MQTIAREFHINLTRRMQRQISRAMLAATALGAWVLILLLCS